jgi:Zn-finger nucleic acid-binding protein
MLRKLSIWSPSLLWQLSTLYLCHYDYRKLVCPWERNLGVQRRTARNWNPAKLSIRQLISLPFFAHPDVSWALTFFVSCLGKSRLRNRIVVLERNCPRIRIWIDEGKLDTISLQSIWYSHNHYSAHHDRSNANRFVVALWELKKKSNTSRAFQLRDDLWGAIPPPNWNYIRTKFQKGRRSPSVR